MMRYAMIVTRVCSERAWHHSNGVFRYWLLLLWTGLLPNLMMGQSSLDDIKNAGDKGKKKCKSYDELIKSLPVDSRLSLEVIDGEISLYMDQRKTFDAIFDKKYDGIAIDVVARNQYRCDGNQLAGSWAHKGQLLNPIFRNELRDRMLEDVYHQVMVPCGQLPEKYDPMQVECNLILLQKKYHCEYRQFTNLEYNQWGLLKMGLYRDSLQEKMPDEFKLMKELQFDIPFEKNRHEFNKADIQPLYDSLQLSDYYLRALSIKTYASVEGDSSHNERLQHSRALSIVRALQTYQDPEIAFEFSSLENWEDFYRDIKESRYAYLAHRDRASIKGALKRLHLEDSMELLLSSHRRASITLQLERKVLVDTDPEAVVAFFNQQVRRNHISEALYVQNYLFDQIRHNQLPEAYIGRLQLPKIATYNPLLTNAIIFQYEHSVGSIRDHLAAFEELQGIMPNNVQVLYNLAALKLTTVNEYTFGDIKEELWKTIRKIEWKVDKTLISRLKINYFILNTEYLRLQKAYREKNKSLKQVYSLYRQLDLSDQERLFLARYLASYSQFKWATTILADRAYEPGVAPKLLDYYLRLTISNPRSRRSTAYKNLLRHTAENRPEVFCPLLWPKAQGGYTFQLLEEAQLATWHCQYCGK